MSKLPTIEFISCRFDASDADEPGHYGVPRDWHEDRFHQMLETIGCNNYGHAEENSPLIPCEIHMSKHNPLAHYVIDTPLFTIRPFYWGDNHEVYNLPNFVYKPWSFEIEWYKWPMRSATMNIKLSDEDWTLMCETCERYVKTFAETQTWPKDADDFPRMSQEDEIAWEMRKQISKANVRANQLEDLLYELFTSVDIPKNKLRSDIMTILDITEQDLKDMKDDEDKEE